MRKLWYAGAAFAGGIFLFGASPAQADLLPGAATAEQQADQRLADLLGQSNGVNVSNPLGYSSLGDTAVGKSPLMQFRSGQNSPDLNPLLPGESAGAPRPDLPAADVVGGALARPANGFGGFPARQVPVSGLSSVTSALGTGALGGLPLLGGLLPNGSAPAATGWTAQHPEQYDGGVPLLGGLGGMLPANTLTGNAPASDKPDTTGLPLGGITVADPAGLTATDPAPGGTATGMAGTNVPGTVAPSTAAPAAGTAADAATGTGTAGATAGVAPAGAAAGSDPAARPGSAKPKPAVTPDDPRLHEEPVDGEAAHRPFSPNGRPVALVDRQYK